MEVEYASSHHADILCSLGPMVDEAEWQAKGLSNYGLIAVNADGNAAQVNGEEPQMHGFVGGIPG